MTDHTNHQAATKSQTRIISTKNLAICLALLLVAFVAIFVFKIPTNTLFIGAVVLACPLMHYWMMKDMNHKT